MEEYSLEIVHNRLTPLEFKVTHGSLDLLFGIGLITASNQIEGTQFLLAICLCSEVFLFWRVYVGKVIWLYYQIGLAIEVKVEKAETAVSAYLDTAFRLRTVSA